MNNQNKYQKKYPLIIKNKKFFESLIKQVENKKISEEKRFEYALLALNFASDCPTGYYYSNVLEDYFTSLANKIHLRKNIEYKKGTCLHVMTLSFKTGGHTRVVERWIEMYKNSVHSLLLINQNNTEIPHLLLENLKKQQGNLYVLEDNLDIMQKALKLREIAMGYEYIVLHIHMNDPVATIAFGTDEFTRPVLFFNHANFRFWIGKRISDVVLDFCKSKNISNDYRNIKEAKICKIPIKNNEQFLSKNEARKKLGLDLKEKIILISGNNFKFFPVCDDSLIDVLEEIILKFPEIKIKILGIRENNKYYNNFQKKYNVNIELIKPLPYQEYKEYVSSADLIIDSYPCSGGVTLIDAISADVPFLSLDNPIGQTDFVVQSLGFCKTKQELIEKFSKAISQENYLMELLKNEKEKLEESSNQDKWVEELNKVLKNLPKAHKIRPKEEDKEPIFINDYTVLVNNMTNFKNLAYKKHRKKE